jgi:hypothetical protein
MMGILAVGVGTEQAFGWQLWDSRYHDWAFEVWDVIGSEAMYNSFLPFWPLGEEEIVVLVVLSMPTLMVDAWGWGYDDIDMPWCGWLLIEHKEQKTQKVIIGDYSGTSRVSLGHYSGLYSSEPEICIFHVHYWYIVFSLLRASSRELQYKYKHPTPTDKPTHQTFLVPDRFCAFTNLDQQLLDQEATDIACVQIPIPPLYPWECVDWRSKQQPESASASALTS